MILTINRIIGFSLYNFNGLKNTFKNKGNYSTLVKNKFKRKEKVPTARMYNLWCF